MSLLSPRLQLAVKQKQILTPGLVQMVRVLQLNRLELREMIEQEIEQNPVLEESAELGEELTPAEVQALLEAERNPNPSDAEMLAITSEAAAAATSFETDTDGAEHAAAPEPESTPGSEAALTAEQSQPEDPFDQIDFGNYFDEWMDPGYRSLGSEDPDKPSFEQFLSSPVTLTQYLRSQLSMQAFAPDVREATDAILGNLDETGYLSIPLEEIAEGEGLPIESLEAALKAIQELDPAGVGARSLQECLLLQLESRNARDSVAWVVVRDHLKLVESKSDKELCRLLDRPMEHIQTALDVIRHLDPKPGLKYSGPGARQVEPDVFIEKDGDDYIITLSDEDLPQLRINSGYRRLLDREQEPDKETRNYIKERFVSALQLIRNIEQRKQTILKVCQAIVGRQREFLEFGIDHLRPMMIKDVAEEMGVHASTVSRAVAGKYAHTPQGVFELRYFFSEAVQGPSGADISLLTLKRMVKAMIEQEDSTHPLTDDQIATRLQQQGIQVTRRTVAKYREDMKIPSTHHRRVRN